MRESTRLAFRPRDVLILDLVKELTPWLLLGLLLFLFASPEGAAVVLLIVPTVVWVLVIRPARPTVDADDTGENEAEESLWRMDSASRWVLSLLLLLLLAVVMAAGGGAAITA